NQAIGLLTDESTKLPFDLHDSTRAVMEKGSVAETWREQLLKAGNSRVYEKSLKEVLLEMADKRDNAQRLLKEIEAKDAEINSYLTGIQTQATGVQAQAQKLQTAGQADRMFTAESVTANLLPSVLSDEKSGGLIARGMALKDSDPVRAWDEFGDVAKRMSTEAAQIVAIGNDARGSLLPTLKTADDKLHPHEVKTEWAHDQKEILSQRLDKAANTAMRTSVAEELKVLQGDIDALEARVNTVVDQDHKRREVSPRQMADAEKDVDTARAEIHGKLQQMGVFKKGTPDQVLREPKLDPTTRTQEAHKNHDAIKGRLDVGDIETAGTHLQNITDLTQDAHRLVKETREALAAYPNTLKERKGRRQSITESIPKTYQPSLDRIMKTYAPDVLRLVAPDVGAGDTLRDNVDQANVLLGAAGKSTAQAEVDFDKAYLLTARDGLGKTDEELKNAQAQLDMITKAEKLLADKQAAAEKELTALQGRLQQTQGKANANYVRGQAKQLLSQASQKLGEASALVQRQPRNPYDAEKALALAESVRSQCDRAIETDRQAYESARSSISSAESAITSAVAAIAAANGQSWNEHISDYGSVSESVSAGDLAGASALLVTAQSELSAANRLMSSQDYEGADRQADEARSSAGSASAAAAAAVSAARSRFDSEVSHGRSVAASVQRQRDEDARRASESNSSSWDSGSSGGGWSGGGGSGTSGGGF
ncbi:MAG: hypothetical protein AB1758_00505, partial [Candidatus Eremiobacterota bacterium]